MDDDDLDLRMTVGAHLEALRWHVLKAIGIVTVLAVVCFVYQKPLMDWATYPHRRVQDTLVREARVKGAPSELQDLVGDIDEQDKALEKAVARVRRLEAKARDKVVPAKARLEKLRQEQATLAKALSALDKQAVALAEQEKPDAQAIANLKKEREILSEEVVKLHQQMQDAAAPFLDTFAKARRTELVALKYQEPFLAYLKLAIVAAIFLGSPLVIRELWKFVAVGLYPKEKRHIKMFAPLSLVMFLAGGAFGYFVLIPIGLYFLATYAPADLVAGTFSMGAYLSLFITLTVVVGMVFQLPLVMAFLSLVGLVSHQQFRKYRGYAWLGGAIMSAMLTPPDPFTQLLMLGPMGVLYEVGIFASMVLGAKRAERVEAEAAEAAAGALPAPRKPKPRPSSGSGDVPTALSEALVADPPAPVLQPVLEPRVSQDWEEDEDPEQDDPEQDDPGQDDPEQDEDTEEEYEVDQGDDWEEPENEDFSQLEAAMAETSAASSTSQAGAEPPEPAEEVVEEEVADGWGGMDDEDEEL